MEDGNSGPVNVLAGASYRLRIPDKILEGETDVRPIQTRRCDMVACVRRGFLSLVLLAYPAGILTAQGTGTIYGNVTDPSGSALTEARVTARMVERGLTRSSTVNMSDAGQYNFWIQEKAVTHE